jgi:hypothetical protein
MAVDEATRAKAATELLRAVGDRFAEIRGSAEPLAGSSARVEPPHLLTVWHLGGYVEVRYQPREADGSTVCDPFGARVVRSMGPNGESVVSPELVPRKRIRGLNFSAETGQWVGEHDVVKAQNAILRFVFDGLRCLGLVRTFVVLSIMTREERAKFREESIDKELTEQPVLTREQAGIIVDQRAEMEAPTVIR